MISRGPAPALAQGGDRLGDEEGAAVLQALLQGPLAPLDEAPGGGLALVRGKADVQTAVPLLDREGLQVVPRGEEAAAGVEVELPVVPVADEDAVADAALGHGVAHVGAAVVDRVKAAPVAEEGEVGAVDAEGAAFPFGDVGGVAQPVVFQRGRRRIVGAGRLTHGQPPRREVGREWGNSGSLVPRH